MIRYDDYISPEEYLELRKLVGWRLFPLEEAKKCVENAYMVLCVRDDEKAIGVVRLSCGGGWLWQYLPYDDQSRGGNGRWYCDVSSCQGCNREYAVYSVPSDGTLSSGRKAIVPNYRGYAWLWSSVALAKWQGVYAQIPPDEVVGSARWCGSFD